MQRRNFLAAVGLHAVLGPRQGQPAVQDPLPPKGVQLDYRVLFGDSEIGRQSVRIREHDQKGHVIVEHAVKLEVRVLFSVAYALEHRSTEIWDGFTLKSIRSESIENGERSVIEGDATADGFRIRKAGKAWLAPRDTVPSDSFWIAAAMGSASVVNTRTGDTAKPMLRQLSDGRWHLKADFAHGPVQAHMRFDGEFLAEAEIDSDGHTVKLRRIAA